MRSARATGDSTAARKDDARSAAPEGAAGRAASRGAVLASELAAAGAGAASGCPQSPQNRHSGGRAAPQYGQITAGSVRACSGRVKETGAPRLLALL